MLIEGEVGLSVDGAGQLRKPSAGRSAAQQDAAAGGVRGCSKYGALLVEPNLFLIDSEGAATRFAAALVSLLQKVSDGT